MECSAPPGMTNRRIWKTTGMGLLLLQNTAGHQTAVPPVNMIMPGCKRRSEYQSRIIRLLTDNSDMVRYFGMRLFSNVAVKWTRIMHYRVYLRSNIGFPLLKEGKKYNLITLQNLLNCLI